MRAEECHRAAFQVGAVERDAVHVPAAGHVEVVRRVEVVGDDLVGVDAALRRIEDGSYGYCEETGEPITLAPSARGMTDATSRAMRHGSAKNPPISAPSVSMMRVGATDSTPNRHGPVTSGTNSARRRAPNNGRGPPRPIPSRQRTG